LEILAPLWSRFPRLKVLLVPRHPERFNEVAGLLEKARIPFSRFSQTLSPEAKVVLIDAMGLLRNCYQLATVALVAGSYTAKVGGHNVLEPSWYGVPVVFGPEMHSQPELVELVKDYASGLQVPPEALQSTLEDLLTHPEKRAALGQAGLHLVGEMHGATLKTWEVERNLGVC
jgi:3-deoxy-D-manno-octulosonic-acid transferase